MKVLIIMVGVMIASAGEIRISWIGICFQVGGLVFEAMRLVMTEVLMSNNGEKMDPLVSLYYYAPVCAAFNLVMVYFSEMGSFQLADFQRVGASVLVLNALVAFFLNVASVFLVGLLGSFTPPWIKALTSQTDQQDKQPCNGIVWHFQEHSLGGPRSAYIWDTHQWLADVWLPHCNLWLVRLLRALG